MPNRSPFVHRSLAGELLTHHTPGDVSALNDAFQVMERLRARGLMETLLAEDRAERQTPAAVEAPTLGQVQARLSPQEALLSFQVWRPEPTMQAPFREGSSWLTVVTRTRVDAFPLAKADLLEAQVRPGPGCSSEGTVRIAPPERVSMPSSLVLRSRSCRARSLGW